VKRLTSAGAAEEYIRAATGKGVVLSRQLARSRRQKTNFYTPRQILGTFRGEILPVQKHRGLFDDSRPRLNNIDALALEMALHEESEREALEGELAALELAWREAEEIAAIADSLPYDLGDRLRALRKR
jgi:hypothetical protein